MTIEIPRLVSVETTNHCNAKCSFCPNNALQRKRQAMANELFEKIIDDCTKFKLPAIEPFLQGEPFVDPKIFDRLALINSKLPNTALRLYSNGAALTPEKADRLRELNVSSLYISLNTMDKERYERIVGLPFEQTIRHLEYIASHGNKAPVAQQITVRLTLTAESTKNELREFKKMCKQLNIRPMTVGLYNYKGDIHSSLPVPSYPCTHIDRLDILVNGQTTLCCMDQEGEFGWGSVKSSSVLDVFNNEKAIWLRSAHRNGHRKKTTPCDRCNLFYPSFSGMNLAKQTTGLAKFLWYFVRYQPLRSPKQLTPGEHI